jgi:lipoprotein-anchoring transpeptidase ErfK/SrfK
MKSMYPILGAAVALALLAAPAGAGQRYAEPPPLVVSPDLSAPWVLQLRRVPRNVRVQPAPVKRYQVKRYAPGDPLPSRAAYQRMPAPDLQERRTPDLRNAYVVPQGPNRAPKVVPMYTEKQMERPFDPKFLPREVKYDGPQKPGTIVIDTKTKFLYLVQDNGRARRYGVGVGKEGFGWTGTETVSRKAEWPGWTPPSEMIAREKAKGRVLPAHMEGGLANPLGARALSRKHALSHPRHQRTVDNRPQCVVGMHPDAQSGRGGPLRTRQSRHKGGRVIGIAGEGTEPEGYGRRSDASRGSADG